VKPRTPSRQHQGLGRPATLPCPRNQEPKIANSQGFPSWSLFSEPSLGHLSSHGCARFAIYYRLFSGMSICLVVRFSKLAAIPPPGKVASRPPGPATPARQPIGTAAGIRATCRMGRRIAAPRRRRRKNRARRIPWRAAVIPTIPGKSLSRPQKRSGAVKEWPDGQRPGCRARRANQLP